MFAIATQLKNMHHNQKNKLKTHFLLKNQQLFENVDHAAKK